MRKDKSNSGLSYDPLSYRPPNTSAGHVADMLPI